MSRNSASSSSSLLTPSFVDIPSRRPVERFLSSADPNVFVGSPEQFLTPPGTTFVSRPHSLIGSMGRSSRPTIGNRSVSSPMQHRSRANTTQARLPSGLHNLVEANPRTPRESWTLFGELMEHGSPGSPTANRPSRRTGSSPMGRRGLSVTPRGSVSSFLDGYVSLVSPVAEEPSIIPATAPPHREDFEPPDASMPSSDNDDGYDSADSDTSIESVSTPPDVQTERSRIPRLADVPLVYRNVFKCGLAYFIASLFTYNPYISDFISSLVRNSDGDRNSPLPGGHMVATVAVYFHPAKTMGAMFEADLFFFFGIFYSAFVCLFAMSAFLWLELQGWLWFSDFFVIAWIACSMTGLAWMKVWMASPQFNTVCSMMAIIIFVVLVREGGLDSLLEVSFIVSMGCTISNLVCLFVWPQTATSNLQANMTQTLDSFSTILNLLTKTFLLEEGPHQPNLVKIQKAAENHQNSFTSLKNSLKEAQSEWRFTPSHSPVTGADLPDHHAASKGDQRTVAYEDAVDSLNRLGQHLNGLRGGTRLQFELTKAGVVRTRKRNSKKGKSPAFIADENDNEETILLKAAGAMFGDLVEDLGPPLKALSTTCTASIKRLRDSFVRSHESPGNTKPAIQPHEFMELVDGIEASLLRFESTSNHALLRIYRKSHAPSIASGHQGDRRSTLSALDDALVSEPENEHVFLVYFFIFTLQEFASELVLLIDAMERVYTLEQRRRTWRTWMSNTYESFTTWWSSSGRRRKVLQRKLSSYIKPNDRRHPRPAFPKVKPHAPDTLQTPSRSNLTFIGKIKQAIWLASKRFSERDLKYAVKVGVSAAMLAAPAFFDSTRTIFVQNWGDWALISFFVVMSPTIGATNYLSVHRILGTIFGAAVATLMYTVFPDNAVILSIFGFFFSLPCFYVIVATPTYASSSRFVLLTYNLTCLYCYNQRDKDISASYVAMHRALAVVVGVLWAAFVSRFWWPSEARRELSKALSEFCLNIGWLYTRLVASNSFAPEFREEGDESRSDGSASLAEANSTRLNNSIQEFMAMELHLQIKLIEIQGLLQQTQHEPRLKGPFPVKLYRGILASLQTILDRLHSMRCVTTREEWYTSVRKDFIIPVNKERHEMVGNIILYFSTLSSAFRLKAPLPPYLPPAEKSRQRLADAVRQLEVVRNRNVKGSRQLLFFAYTMTMKGVTEELESLGQTLQGAFGVIGQSPEEFDALFVDPDESRARLDWAA